MKKSVAILMVLAIVLSLSSFAFAATAYPDDVTTTGTYDDGSYDYDYDGGYDFDYDYDFDFDIPGLKREKSKPAVSNVGLLICLMEDDTVYQFVPMPQVVNVEYKDAANINNTKAREAFADAYKEAKAVEGKHLRKAYWFNIPNTYTLDDEHYAKYTFACEGSHVEVTVNGEPVEVVSINGRTSYIAKVTARGTIAIYSDK